MNILKKVMIDPGNSGSKTRELSSPETGASKENSPVLLVDSTPRSVGQKFIKRKCLVPEGDQGGVKKSKIDKSTDSNSFPILFSKMTFYFLADKFFISQAEWAAYVDEHFEKIICGGNIKCTIFQ